MTAHPSLVQTPLHHPSHSPPAAHSLLAHAKNLLSKAKNLLPHNRQKPSPTNPPTTNPPNQAPLSQAKIPPSRKPHKPPATHSSLSKAKNLLHLAKKTLHYKRHSLTSTELTQLLTEIQKLELAIENKDPQLLRKNTETLQEQLKKIGGKIYPPTFLNENLEVLLIAMLLALSVRAFFLQPFKIPTNSMYPSFAGHLLAPHQQNEPTPLWKKNIHRFIKGSRYHTVLSPCEGYLGILINKTNSTISFATKTSQLTSLGIPQALRKTRYIFYVGSQEAFLETPIPLDISTAFLRRYFPKAPSFSAWFQKAEREGQVLNLSEGIYLVKTDIKLKKGEDILSVEILSGDLLVVDKFSYHFFPPKVGEAIVFRTDHIPGLRVSLPQRRWRKLESYYIKRLVGLPNDTLSLKGHTLYRDGKMAEGSEVFKKNAHRVDGYPGYTKLWRWEQEEQTPPIPPRYFYVLGDNSLASYDSRGWGYDGANAYQERRSEEEINQNLPVNLVPQKSVVGRSLWILYPFTHRFGRAR